MNAPSPHLTLLSGSMLLALALIWGGSFFFQGVLVQSLPPLTIVWARVGIAALGLLVYLHWRGVRLPAGRDAWLALAVMGLLNNVVPFGLIVWGQTAIPSGLAAILNATTPIFTVLVAHFAFADERLSVQRVIGVLAGVLGVAVMFSDGLEGSWPLWAQAAVLGAALSYGLSAIWGRRLVGLGVVPLQAAAGQVCCSTLWLTPVVLLIDQPWALDAPGAGDWWSLLGLGLLCTGLAYVLYFEVLARAGATNLSLVTLLVPVSAMVLGWLFLGERLGPHHLAGFGSIAAGLLVLDGRLVKALVRSRI